MSVSDIAEKLMMNGAFLDALRALEVHAAVRQFEAVLAPSAAFASHDWHQLLLSASILLAHDDEDSQAAALRIAICCFRSDDSNAGEKEAALRILDRQANQPAIDLALSRYGGDLTGSTDSILSRMEKTRNRLESTIQLSDGSNLRLNRFQQAFWMSINDARWLSVSAPTSAGKSFVVLQWLGEAIRQNEIRDAVYIVPTRALISQVEADLNAFAETHQLPLNVSSIPRRQSLSMRLPNVLVFTQERLHLFMMDAGGLPESIGAVIVDEAQKIGDRHRGVLLQDVLERITLDDSQRKVIFLSPMTENPELLTRDAPPGAVTNTIQTHAVSVSQNLLWVSQVFGKPKQWSVQLCIDGQQVDLGQLTLPNKPVPISKRLPFVALSMSHKTGNLIYVNAAADAEKASLQLFDCLEDIESEEVSELIDLVKHTIHPRFQLARFLQRGIAFHYGNMPLLIKTRVEELFTRGIIRFLVCTSTLVEGVNMSCKNIFVRGPKKGRRTLMAADDFWNLAGRAGRLGKEFVGNIVCVDSNKPELWANGEPPRKRTRFKIQKSADQVISSPAELLKYIDDGSPRSEAARRPDLEFVMSYLYSTVTRYGALSNAPWAKNFAPAQLVEIEGRLDSVRERVELPDELVQKNIGISPLALQGLLEHFRKRVADGKTHEDLIPAEPGSDDIVLSYTRVFASIADHVNARLGPKGPRGFMLALLVSKWLSGYSLARLVDERIRRWQEVAKRPPDKQPASIPNVAAIIRTVMDDVEQIARFEAPRAMSAYIDVLRFFLVEQGDADAAEDLDDIAIYLELGLSQETQISLVSLGLSRSTAIALSEVIEADALTDSACLDWLESNPWHEFSIPELMKREIATILERTRSASQ